MSDWAPKRFWKAASVAEADGGHTVHLDGRAIRTPAKAPLVVPSRALAEAIAVEWDAQEQVVDPRTMPATRAANAAIDKVTPQRAEVAKLLADYGDSDLLCYRAEAPVELVTRQAEAWDPMLDWAEEVLGARLAPRTGVMHAPQDPAALQRLAAQVDALPVFELTAFHDLVGLTGSLVLGFATYHGARPAEDIWTLSRIDEDWQESQWGVDEEARNAAEVKRASFLNAKQLLDLLRSA